MAMLQMVCAAHLGAFLDLVEQQYQDAHIYYITLGYTSLLAYILYNK